MRKTSESSSASTTKFKVGDRVLINQLFAQDHLSGKELRGVVSEVKKMGLDRRQWYIVQIIDYGMETISYDENLKLDPLQSLAAL